MTGKALTPAPGRTDAARRSRASSPGAAGEDGAQASAVLVRGLAKRYGEIEAVRGIDFSVHAGETFGFLGPNGAGKSTTINMLCTLVRPTAGVALVAGHTSCATATRCGATSGWCSRTPPSTAT